MSLNIINFDVCVIGAGSGGFGAALAAARSGLNVALVESQTRLGGNAVHGGVHHWEHGVGGTAFPREIYERLRRMKENVVGITGVGRHWYVEGRNHPPFPGGEILVDDSLVYEDTLMRCGTKGIRGDPESAIKMRHGVVFEPEAMSKVQYNMLRETNNCEIYLETRFVECVVEGGVLKSVLVEGPFGATRICADYFVDSTAGAVLCERAGCSIAIGRESKAIYGERLAPAESEPNSINGVTLVYRISPVGKKLANTVYEEEKCWFRKDWPPACFVEYPCGDLNVNTLPTMEGSEFLEYIKAGKFKDAYAECLRRVKGHWNYLLHDFPEFRAFKFKWVAPSLGVRETRRIVGEYVLTEDDVIGGLASQRHDDIIAIADHALDAHRSDSKGTIELKIPYGIPYRCLLPKELSNTLVACRGSSFSSIAASSCRLSRTMMDMGHAAGLATALAHEYGVKLKDVDPELLRQRLRDQGATLSLEEAYAVRSKGTTAKDVKEIIYGHSS